MFWKIVRRGLIALVGIGLVVRCVSRTGPELRFHESRGLQGAVAQITVPDPEHFSFVAVGDTHLGSADRLRRILDAAKAEGDAFVILLGDITDQGDLPAVQLAQDTIAKSAFAGKTLAVIGNHDVFGNGWNTFRDAFGPSHFNTQIGNTRFLAFDTADGTLGEQQALWLKNQTGPGSATNTIWLSHYLPVIPGERTYLKLGNESEAVRLMKLAADNGVRSWLGAHFHSFAMRTITGVNYVVAGGGGGRRMGSVRDFFYVQGIVDGPHVSYVMHKIR